MSAGSAKLDPPVKTLVPLSYTGNALRITRFRMEQVQAEVEAAKRLIAALDAYEVKFQAMVVGSMDAAAYEEVNVIIEEIRAAKLVIFRRIATEAVEFLLAHSSLMTALWDVQLARLRRTISASARSVPALTADHDHAIDYLRGACEKIVELSGKAIRKPPAAPSAGL
jgi:hypothetical protein